ncbi:MAG: hypothetical protein Q4D51_14745, partial [Eubacteriales bacterium]|nr:hypothetical protein [Eubacteriales bacterium]
VALDSILELTLSDKAFVEETGDINFMLSFYFDADKYQETTNAATYDVNKEGMFLAEFHFDKDGNIKRFSIDDTNLLDGAE